MLSDFYQTLDSPEQIGKNIVIPDSSHKALHLSEHGELFCYSGIYGRDKSQISYIAFDSSGYSFSHVSLYGFYRHIGVMLSMGANTVASKMFEHKTFSNEIIGRIKQINDYFPFEVKVTQEYVIPEMYVE